MKIGENVAWFEEYGFIDNPYEVRTPKNIPLDEIVWSRSDMNNVKEDIENFIDDLEQGYVTSLAGFSRWRGGKSWLNRYIEKRVYDRLDNILFIRIDLTRVGSNLSAFYRKVINNLVNVDEDTAFMEKIKQEYSDEAELKEVFGSDLGHILFQIIFGSAEVRKKILKAWLEGFSPSKSNLRDENLHYSIKGREDLMLEILEQLINEGASLFNRVVLSLDQLESAKTFAQDLSDILRDLSDEMSENLALCLFYTGESADWWFDHGYGDALYHRIDYKEYIKPLELGASQNFIRTQNKIYREEGWTGSDQIYPFTEESIEYLVKLMGSENSRPGFILENCKVLARDAYDEGEGKVEKAFIEEKLSKLENIKEQKELV